MLTQREFDRRRRQMDEEFAIAERRCRTYAMAGITVGAVLVLLVAAALVGLVWWAWTGQHPFGGR